MNGYTATTGRPRSPLWAHASSNQARLSSKISQRGVQECRAGQKRPQQSVSDPAAGASWADISRRALLQTLSVGTAYSWAVRNAHAADAVSLEQQLEQRVHEFQLSNGLRFIVSERHAAPIVSCNVYADVGAFEEVDGLTGMAHLLEHMAFKGTPTVGTTDFRKEAPLLDQMDEVFYTLRESAPGGREASRLQSQLAALQSRAAELSVPNAYGSLLQRQGAVGLNAATSQDATRYYCSLPANKLELWFALEAGRFQAPVFRELYSEKAVVSEERRLRVENTPLGVFQEQFALRSLANNYRRPVVGFQSDIDRIGRREVQAFFQQHYGPTNLVIAVAGDVRPEEVQRLAEKYFGGWNPSPPPPLPPPAAASDLQAPASAGAVWGEEPLARPALGAGSAELAYRGTARGGPLIMQAYYRPSATSEDAVAVEMLGDALSGSRSSRLYRQLVLQGSALSIQAVEGYPGEKRAGQFLIYAVPPRGRSLEALDADISAQLEALAGDGPTASELRRYKKSARSSLLQALASNSTMAAALASYQVTAGDWRGVLSDLARIEAMEQEGVREVAGRLFSADNCFRGFVSPA